MSSSSVGISSSVDMTVVGVGISATTRQGLAQGMGKTDYIGKTAGLDESPETTSTLSSSRIPVDGERGGKPITMESYRTKSASAKFARTTGR